MPGALASTAIGGYNMPPYQGAPRFGDAISGGRGAGHKMTDATQQVLSIPVFVRPWKSGWHRNYTEGTVLFNAPNGTGYGGGSSPLETLLSVPLLNYMLDISANPLSSEDPDALGHGKGRAFLSGATMDQVLENFRYLGIVRNELATDGKPVYDPWGPTHQRLLNVDVGGYSKIPNIFEPSVCRGDTLWLVIRQATTHRAEAGRPIIRPDGTVAAFERASRPLQVEGVATRTGTPTPFGTFASRSTHAPTLGSADVSSPMEWSASTGCGESEDAAFELFDGPGGESIGMAFYPSDTTPEAAAARSGVARAAKMPSMYRPDESINRDCSHRATAVRLGIVKDVCRTVSADSIARAMREHDAWSRQPRLGVLLGV